MYRQRLGARAEYRQQEGQRVKESATLSNVFGKLKSLTVDLEYSDPEGLVKGKRIKYEVNLANAKSVFRFKCPNNECIRGDFDLSKDIAEAVAKHRTTVEGDMSCRGITIYRVHCANSLHYTLALRY